MRNWVYTMILFVAVACYWRAGAIVVEDYSVATNPPSGSWDLNWDYVYNYKNSSSVAVGEYWILTAAHVADDGSSGDLTIDGTTYFQQEIIFHAGADDPENTGNADLALVRYDKPLPGFYDLYTGSFSASSELILAGFGNIGSVFEAGSGGPGGGPPLPGVFDYYTDSGSGRGTKRWGTQKYNSSESAKVYTADSLITTNNVFWMRFDIGNTTYEAGVGPGDSGGGSFIQDSGVWKLAGINTLRSGVQPKYTGIYAVSVPDYATWITQTMDAVTGDDDTDGLPNWWEEQYATDILAGADQDGDGFNGEEEYIADTDPTDSGSFFQMDGVMTATSQTFTFDGSPARQYQLLYTPNDLADPGIIWITNGVPIWGEGASTQITVNNTEETVFYRVEVILP